jgi:hypothetical protein
MTMLFTTAPKRSQSAQMVHYLVYAVQEEHVPSVGLDTWQSREVRPVRPRSPKHRVDRPKGPRGKLQG